VRLQCLIVDDNASFLDAASTLLERQGLAIVGVASNGDKALRLAHAQRPDVVLLDIDLGGESGFDIARRLASVNGGGDGALTVILVSTHAESEFADLIEAAPAAGFLSKSQLSAEAIKRLVR
jgi:DNA-binding NarL/FixJ family response regulator